MSTKISLEDLKRKTPMASNKTELAGMLGVTKQYLEYFLKSNGLKIEAKLAFSIKEKPRF
jgi:hypothetical protein